MNICIIGSTAYQDKMFDHRYQLEEENHDVRLPAFDGHQEMNEYQVCEYNRSLIEWADEVHVLWDGRSTGTIFDLGMCFALKKPLKLIYLNRRSFHGLVLQMDEKTNYITFPKV